MCLIFLENSWPFIIQVEICESSISVQMVLFTKRHASLLFVRLPCCFRDMRYRATQCTRAIQDIYCICVRYIVVYTSVEQGKAIAARLAVLEWVIIVRRTFYVVRLVPRGGRQ